jgi:hypothetical protein
MPTKLSGNCPVTQAGNPLEILMMQDGNMHMNTSLLVKYFKSKYELVGYLDMLNDQYGLYHVSWN